MGAYESWAYSSYKIPHNLYNYLLPVYGKCAIGRTASYPTVYANGAAWFFVGNKYQYQSMLSETEFFREDEKIQL